VFVSVIACPDYEPVNPSIKLRLKKEHILYMIPMSLESNAVCNPVTASAANQKTKAPSISHNAGNGRKQARLATSNKSQKTTCLSTSTLSDNFDAADATENTNVHLPAFE
jgi:hypothetical protein